ncbi:ABC transporter ATP-binding protein [Rhizobium paknamense]|uniref:NitT/TauT family transport system ATP-binding protein n=1 Tax=Rhizobium paknamense TaxID=1206817 RepID=A0ABU0IHW4_9HYPH|nr:ABC transporter ATP-binding protein [Rhizobium paknamense]MDQ0456789.1 NitT/TauT family transport system ATP-binding protein [Rhizobium paknamense]
MPTTAPAKAVSTEVKKARPLVVMQSVSKTFSSGTIALSEMSMTVESGEFVSLLGPSGCGKSTALRIIAGLGGVSSGSIDWPSSRINSRGLPEGDIGFVFQEPTLLPWKTVFDNVHLPLKLRGTSKALAREEIMAVLATVGLADFASAYPRELSGGMKMRVSIARALVTRPKLLLMDEPFAALDEITRQKLNDDVLALWKSTGITVIFVTHSVFESAYLSNRVVLMKARPGRVHADLPLITSRDRDADYRTSEEYRAACETVSHALIGAINAAKEEG